MMASNLFCPKCQAYMNFPESHKCPPTWDVELHDENIRLWTGSVIAVDASAAAEKAAAEYDREERNLIMSGDVIQADVILEDGSIQTYDVDGFPVPSYSARLRQGAT